MSTGPPARSSAASTIPGGTANPPPDPFVVAAKTVPTSSPSLPRPGTTLDSTWDRRLRSGAIKPDRIVDLHGMNLDTAWRAIDRSLDQAIEAGDRVVLLITGHHRPGDPPVKRGQIRAAVHD